MPVGMLKQWIDASYRAVAPKRLVAALDAAESPAGGAGCSTPSPRRR
jgi:hypothetical protein